ncbi:hypothetical protein ACGFIW_29045 [Micromonospora sp. NPDC048935]|uniref:hypothetical protein n=1 Tax=Micromonospora sp. NPDC048935 TaxID=3364262 RepID=UPI0037206DE6
MRQGERPITATRAMVGRFSAGRLGTVVSQGLIQAAAGATGAALARTKKQFLVLTDQRLIFLPQTFFGGPGTGVLGEVPREHVTLAEAKIGIVSLLRVAFGGAGDGVTLTFPRVDKKSAAALPPVPAA